MARIVSQKTLKVENKNTGHVEQVRFKVMQASSRQRKYRDDGDYYLVMEVVRNGKVVERQSDGGFYGTYYPDKETAMKEMKSWISFFKDVNPHLKEVRRQKRKTTTKKRIKRKTRKKH